MTNLTPKHIKKNNKTKLGRPTKQVVNERITQVATMLLSAKSRSEIIQHCVDNYNLQPTSVTNLVTQAYKYISETHNVDKVAIIDVHVAMYYDLYVMAKALGDSRGACTALASIEKLYRLTQPDALVQHNSLNLNLKDMTVTELKDLLKLT
jgi:prephenate dehydratase